jgi:hypothetical protein
LDGGEYPFHFSGNTGYIMADAHNQ